MSRFEERNSEVIAKMADDQELSKATRNWFDAATRHEYSYHFTWMGRPIIQFPQDMVAVQEIIWKVKPDLIVETGIAHGGSLIFSASMLELLGGPGEVVGVDIEIRPHNRVEIEKHPMFKRIKMIEGSSIDSKIAEQVYAHARGKKRVLVMLDSNHTHDHVQEELKLYAPLVKQGSYLIVFDTVVEDLGAGLVKDRPWGKGNNPKTAVREFLKSNPRFTVDREIENKLQITVAPEGYLKCISD